MFVVVVVVELRLHTILLLDVGVGNPKLQSQKVLSVSSAGTETKTWDVFLLSGKSRQEIL